MACVVLYNMILEDERDDQLEVIKPNVGVPFCRRLYFVMFWQGIKTIENLDLHFRLGNEHMYQLKINEKNSQFF
jgi:hypothetical protein